MGFDVIIPARFQSTRLPGKPLVDLCGKPLIQWVYECAQQSRASMVVVATDDERVCGAVESFGGSVCMTAPTHPSGTDRIAEAISTLDIPADRVVVNLQGDEPQMPGELINQVVDALEGSARASIGTACHTIDNTADLLDPNVVKVIRDQQGYALYFTRAPAPWLQRCEDGTQDFEAVPRSAFRHIGLYAYRAGYVSQFARRPPCELETIERLEQLRTLWHGERIIVCEASEMPGPGIDTPQDLERARQYLASV
ncbi:MAG: 3-deoxy-manno-octulosonate cytidylyltransferase [Gammaproteobacteria bacterium]|nr:3-deoxy-manno-octulosonate cytidylyltransferase [Gammaproteobacteria bacterium]